MMGVFFWMDEQGIVLSTVQNISCRIIKITI